MFGAHALPAHRPDRACFEIRAKGPRASERFQLATRGPRAASSRSELTEALEATGQLQSDMQ